MSARVLLTALVIAMGALLLGLAQRHSLWADEVFSLAMATGHSLEHPAAAARPELGDFTETERPIPAAELRPYAEFETPEVGPGRVVRVVFLSDSSPPLYYLFLYGWLRLFGTDDLALRTLSIACGLAAVWLVFAVGRELGGERVGLVAAGLFAMAPLSLYYAAEGRMYAMLWCWVLLVAWTTLRIRNGRGGVAMEAGWVLGSAAGLLTHYYFVFPWAAAVGFLFASHGGDRRWRLVGRVTLTLVAVLPWYVHLPENLAAWRVTQDWVKWKPPGYRRWVVLRDLLVQYFSGNGHYLWDDHRRAELGALGIFFVTGVVGLWRAGRSAMGNGWGLEWLWFAAACVGPLVADLVRGSYIAEYPRYASAALPAACLLGGGALAALRSRWALAAFLGIGLCWAPSVMSIFRSRARDRQPMRDVARHVSAYGAPTDLVLVHSIPSGVISLARYTTTPAGFAAWVGQLGRRHVPESLQPLIAGRRRVLLVKVHTVGAPAPEETWLREHARLAQTKRLGDVYIEDFRPVEQETF